MKVGESCVAAIWKAKMNNILTEMYFVHKIINFYDSPVLANYSYINKCCYKSGGVKILQR